MRLLKVPHYEMLGGHEELERSLPDFQPIVRAIEPREVAAPPLSCSRIWPAR